VKPGGPKRNQTSYAATYIALSPDRLSMQLGIINSLLCERFHDKDKTVSRPTGQHSFYWSKT